MEFWMIFSELNFREILAGLLKILIYFVRLVMLRIQWKNNEITLKIFFFILDELELFHIDNVDFFLEYSKSDFN